MVSSLEHTYSMPSTQCPESRRISLERIQRDPRNEINHFLHTHTHTGLTSSLNELEGAFRKWRDSASLFFQDN